MADADRSRGRAGPLARMPKALSVRVPWYRDRVAIVGATILFAIHAALANRYDLFRDELYFIVCGRHPAFGYVDQPPLVPLVAAGAYGLAHALWLVRLVPALAAAACVVVTVRLTRVLGGGDGAATTAACAVTIAPMLLGIASTLNTTVFEALAWTAVAYALVRAVALDDRRALVWGGLAAGVALEAKYSLAAWLVALALGVACTSARRLFAFRELWIGLALGALVAVPSVIWQATHGWPFAELTHAAAAKNAVVTPLSFLANQVLVMNPVLAPLWLLGIAAPFARRDLAAFRFLAIAFVALVAFTIAAAGKDYYVAAAYPSMLALGAVALAPFVKRPIRLAYLALATCVSAVVAPVALPILDPPALASYLAVTHLAPQRQERSFAGTTLPQSFADQLGWRTFARAVGDAYGSLPPAERARTAIVVDNYGEAAALDVYGGPYGLPPALSGQNQYYLWAQRGQRPRHLLRVQDDLAALRPFCRSVRAFALPSSPYAMSYENAKSLAFCEDLHPSLETIWPSLKYFG